MRNKVTYFRILWGSMLIVSYCSCGNKTKAPAASAISEINLKRGELVSCGPEKQLGLVEFETSCVAAVKKDFDLALALLHSFEYDESEKVFAGIIDKDPSCAMAYWGVAMCNYHQLWPSPPSPAELEKGTKAVAIARSISGKTRRESDYIEAIGVFYEAWKTTDHHSRAGRLEKAMEHLYQTYPADKEAAIFYALALDGSAVATDKTFYNQKKAGAILSALYPGEPDHPGIVHYIIHSYDYPQLAALALPAAKKYAALAPASAHAQHMPSHIFTRLGLWNESISSNLVSTTAAKCYAEKAGIKGHWDEELHGMDYLVYAYLQQGDNRKAKEQLDYLKTIDAVYPVNFKDAYAFAAIPARFFLENKWWKQAENLEIHPTHFPWEKFPWQKAIFYYARLLGAAHEGHLDSARKNLNDLTALRDTLLAQKDDYKSMQVNIQIKSAEAWINLGEGKKAEAVALMRTAAEMEDNTEKSAVTPGEVLPARELLGDMFMQLKQPDSALIAYETDLLRRPNRFNALYGAAVAAEKLKMPEKAELYYKQLLAISASSGNSRPESAMATSFLKSQSGRRLKSQQ